MVGFVEDQQASGSEVVEPDLHRAGVVFVDQQAMRDNPTRERVPRICGVAVFPTDALHVVSIVDLEGEAEACFEFLLPLLHHRWGTRDDDVVDPTTEAQLVGDQGRFDGFAEAHVVGDEEIDPWQREGLLKGLQLVGIDADTGTERGLEELFVGGGYAVPPESVDVRGEVLGSVEFAFADLRPCLFVEDKRIQFHFPDHFERLALGVVIDASQFY